MSLPKAIRNLLGVDVFVADTGTNILGGADYVIPDREYLLWSESTQAPALIDAGSLAVLYGNTVLSDADGKAFLKIGLGGFLLKERKQLNQATSAIKAVRSTGSNSVMEADSSDISTARVYGITWQGGNAGAIVDVITAGKISDPSISVTIDQPVYLGSNGALTTTAPTSGVHCLIGFGVETNTILVRISEPIQL